MLTKSDLQKLGLTPPKSPNDPCHCGSGKKFKKCCAAPKGYEEPPPKTKEQAAAENRPRKSVMPLLMLLAALPVDPRRM